MDIIFGEIKEEYEKFLDKKFIVFSTLKNGFLKEWIDNRYTYKKNIHSSFTKIEIFSIIYMLFMFIRIKIAMRLPDDNNAILMYFGSLWHYIYANATHCELLFLLWTFNYLSTYLYVIHNDNYHYKWLEIYEFLAGIITHKNIGNVQFFNTINVIKSITFIKNEFVFVFIFG